MPADDSERQALLPGARKNPPPLRKPAGQLLRHGDFTLIMVLPWLTFSLSALCVGMVPQSFRWLTYVIGAACLLNALMFFDRARQLYYDRGPQRDRQGAAGAACIGMLCMVALGAGWTVGLFADGAYMDEYWRLRKGVTYNEVQTSGIGVEVHANASLLNFEKFTFVDTERTLGYMERGQVYCAAPVTGQKFTDSPLYYAVGVNCCDQRGKFMCGQADKEHLSAVVVRDSPSDAQFQTAIRVLEAVYSIAPSKEKRTTVKLVGDAETYQGDLWHSAFLSLLCASIAAGFLFMVAGLLLRSVGKGTPSRSYIAAMP